MTESQPWKENTNWRLAVSPSKYPNPGMVRAGFMMKNLDTGLYREALAFRFTEGFLACGVYLEDLMVLGAALSMVAHPPTREEDLPEDVMMLATSNTIDLTGPLTEEDAVAAGGDPSDVVKYSSAIRTSLMNIAGSKNLEIINSGETEPDKVKRMINHIFKLPDSPCYIHHDLPEEPNIEFLYLVVARHAKKENQQ